MCPGTLSIYPRSPPALFLPRYPLPCCGYIGTPSTFLIPRSFPLSFPFSLSLSLSHLPFFSFSSLHAFPSRTRSRGIPSERDAGLSLSDLQTCVLPAAAHAPTRCPLIPFHKVLPLPRAWVFPRMGDVHSRMVPRRWLRAQ